MESSPDPSPSSESCHELEAPPKSVVELLKYCIDHSIVRVDSMRTTDNVNVAIVILYPEGRNFMAHEDMASVSTLCNSIADDMVTMCPRIIKVNGWIFASIIATYNFRVETCGSVLTVDDAISPIAVDLES
jgi:hypothetical protein